MPFTKKGKEHKSQIAGKRHDEEGNFGSDCANVMWAPTGKSKDWALGTILDSKLLSFKWQEAVSDILSAPTQIDTSNTPE
ncbi:hypothetical protein O181_026275 [Austropuccinia psidii MF-1]|uniref:Uncharacterized protein n=1 Tax=Austropuccinia psidii MF-1 TaxID=1389203 RepID=A0A9Q3CP28_9BASI|nr:hypothetical protein [Austropuccinia psidii MF-1]